VRKILFIIPFFLWTCNESKSSPTDSSEVIPSFNVIVSNIENNSTVSGQLTLNISSSTNNPLSKVEFYLNDQLIGIIEENPFTFIWDTTFNVDGVYSLQVKGFDSMNNNHILTLSINIDNNFDGTFQKTIPFSASGYVQAYSALENEYGGYTIIGKGSLLGVSSNNDILFVKADIKGDLENFNIHNLNGVDTPRDIIRSNDNGYIIVGQTYTGSDQHADAFMMKTDTDGQMLWYKTYDSSGQGGGGYDVALTVHNQGTSGYLVGAGWGGKRYLSILRTSSTGNMTSWNYFGDGTDMGTAYAQTLREENYSPMIQRVSTGGYIMAGYRYVQDESTYLIHLIKLDNSGQNIEWNNTYGNGSPGWMGKVIIESNDNGFIVGGFQGTSQVNKGDLVILKVNSSGQQIWLNKYDGNGSINSIDHTNDGGYILTGYTDTTSNGNLDIYLLKIDSEGNQMWSKKFGGDYNDAGLSVKTVSDGGYLISGYYGTSENTSEIYLIKTDINGNVNQ